MTNLAFPRAWRIIGTACRTIVQSKTRRVESWLKFWKKKHACSLQYQLTYVEIPIKSWTTKNKLPQLNWLKMSNQYSFKKKKLPVFSKMPWPFHLYFCCVKYGTKNEWRPPAINHHPPEFHRCLQKKIRALLHRQTTHEEEHGIHDVKALVLFRWGGIHGAVANHSVGWESGWSQFDQVAQKKTDLGNKKYLLLESKLDSTSSHLQNDSKLYLFQDTGVSTQSSCFLPYHAWCFQSTHLPTPSWQ